MVAIDEETFPSGVLRGDTTRDIARLTDPGVTAVVLRPGQRPGWLDELAALVVERRLVVARTTLAAVSREEFADWARTALAGTDGAVARPLLEDMTGTVERVMAATRVRRVMVRVFTEAPTRRCGFHVDTVPPQAPTTGAVRVYNGPTTEYVACDDVVSMKAFYAYLSRRERVAREAGAGACGACAEAPDGTEATGAETAGAEALGPLVAMDEAPSFLRPHAPVHRVPPDATVYFRHVDVRRHWSPHPVTDAWIHRSPMAGPPRLVLNVSPAQRAPARPGPGPAAHD
ncbi:DUF1826 domain-containing protein [Streptomyces sp. NPDC004267]|uniref:DUF1826 domain-containing protein n=1 Tax=Streptomyces sp. NPDC004267 TaxID=3364694 RepID=UPI0036C0EFF3